MLQLTKDSLIVGISYCIIVAPVAKSFKCSFCLCRVLKSHMANMLPQLALVVRPFSTETYQVQNVLAFIMGDERLAVAAEALSSCAQQWVPV